MDQRKTPLFAALQKHTEQDHYSFHVPGHKNGVYYPEIAREWFLPLLSLDVTELDGLDDLFHPSGVIKEAEALLSDFYQTKKSYFLVNGSTSGNLAMILATCRPGDQVLVQRNAHKSIFNGLTLAHAHPIFIHPEIDAGSGLPTGISTNDLKKSIKRYPLARVLILTYPNYYGMAGDYQSVIREAKAAGLTVLVDEAHGPHFILGDPIPASTLSMGADLVVHSAHKMLPAMTMGSYFHINSETVDKEKVESYLGMLQTSSPSYPIMASLDLARYCMAKVYPNNRKFYIDIIQTFKKELNSIPEIHVIEETDELKIDPFKVIVETCGSGRACQEKLQEAGIYVELATEKHLLFVLPLTPDERLLKSIQVIRSVVQGQHLSERNLPFIGQAFKESSDLALSYEEQAKRNTIYLPYQDTLDLVSAQDITPYPPGIPFVLKGEQISPNHIQAIHSWIKQHVYFQGWDPYKDPRIKVFKDKETIH